MAQPQMNTFTSNTKDKTQNLRDAITEGSNEVSTTLRESANELTETAQEWMHRGQDMVKTARQDSVAFIRANPMATVAGAAAVGLLAGLLMARRK